MNFDELGLDLAGQWSVAIRWVVVGAAAFHYYSLVETSLRWGGQNTPFTGARRCGAPVVESPGCRPHNPNKPTYLSSSGACTHEALSRIGFVSVCRHCPCRRRPVQR